VYDEMLLCETGRVVVCSAFPGRHYTTGDKTTEGERELRQWMITRRGAFVDEAIELSRKYYERR
jgi:hypothetical protein